MSIKSLVGVLAFCSVVLFAINGSVSATGGLGKAIVTTIGTLGKSNYKIATSGSAGSNAKDMFRVMVDNLDLASGDSISLSFTGATDTVNIGSATDPSADGILLTDPSGKGKILKSDRGDTVGGFSGKAIYRFANVSRGKASRLIVMAKLGNASGVIEETAVDTKNVSRSVAVSVNHDDASAGQVNNYRMTGTFQITHTDKRDGTHNFRGIYRP